jgi:hypothetical protein
VHGGFHFVFPPNRAARLVAAQPQGLRQFSTFDPPTDLGSGNAELSRHFSVAKKSLSHCNRSGLEPLQRPWAVRPSGDWKMIDQKEEINTGSQSHPRTCRQQFVDVGNREILFVADGEELEIGCNED